MSKPQLAPPSRITELQRANRARMLQFLREECPLPEFYFGSLIHREENSCGTVCCAIGWAPRIFPDQCTWGRAPYLPILTVFFRGEEMAFCRVANALFGLPEQVAWQAFFPDGPCNDAHSFPPANADATPQQVADRLEYVFGLYP